MIRLTLKPFALAGLLALSLTGFSQGQPQARTNALTDAQKTRLIESINKIMTEFAFVPGVDFKKWPDFLAEQKERLDKANDHGSFAQVITQALNKFGVSHVVVSTPQAAEAMRTTSTVGIGVRPIKVEQGVKIEQVLPGTPAEEAGVLAGDIITEIDGKKADNWDGLRGEEGTKVILTLMRANGKVEKVEVTRRKFSVREPEAIKWNTEEVATLRIPSFMHYEQERVDKLIREAIDKDAKALIVDLRGNGGGQVLHLLHLAGYFVPGQQAIGTWLTRAAVNTYVKETKGSPTDYVKIADHTKSKVFPFAKFNNEPKPIFNGQVIVLTNGGTGSASEMFAAAMRELRSAPIIGSKSAGAVLASMIRPIDFGFTLQYPFQDYVSIKGVRLEGNGLVPDIQAQTPREFFKADDPGVMAALGWLKDKNIVAGK